MFKEDLHLHTVYSPDAKATFEEHIQAGITQGLDVMCFTDHIDVFGLGETLSRFDEKGRNAEFEQYKLKYKDRIKLLNGLEYAEPNLSPLIYKELLNNYPYDMVIGSVHYPMELVFNKQLTDMARLSKMQHEATLAMAEVGGFDVLGHLDFPKKFVSNYILDVTLCKEILSVCVKNGIVLEINTSTLYRGQWEACPPHFLVEYYAQIGGRYVTISSDSHTNATVAYDYDKIYNSLPDGIKVCYFEKRKLIEVL